MTLKTIKRYKDPHGKRQTFWPIQYLHTHVHGSVTTARRQTQPMCPSTNGRSTALSDPDIEQRYGRGAVQTRDTMWVTFENILPSERTPTKRPQIVGFCLYEMLRTANPSTQKAVSGSWGQGMVGKWAGATPVDGVSAWGDGSR